MALPKYYKTTTGRIIPATPTLHKMADKMKLVPAASATEAAPTKAPRGRPAKAKAKE